MHAPASKKASMLPLKPSYRKRSEMRGGRASKEPAKMQGQPRGSRLREGSQLGRESMGVGNYSKTLRKEHQKNHGGGQAWGGTRFLANTATTRMEERNEQAKCRKTPRNVLPRWWGRKALRYTSTASVNMKRLLANDYGD